MKEAKHIIRCFHACHSRQSLILSVKILICPNWNSTEARIPYKNNLQRGCRLCEFDPGFCPNFRSTEKNSARTFDWPKKKPWIFDRPKKSASDLRRAFNSCIIVVGTILSSYSLNSTFRLNLVDPLKGLVMSTSHRNFDRQRWKPFSDSVSDYRTDVKVDYYKPSHEEIKSYSVA